MDFEMMSLLVESLRTAVEVIGSVVRGELVFFSVEGEASLRNAVGHATTDGAERGVAFEIQIKVVEPGDDVAGVAVAVGSVKLGENGAVIHDLGDRAAAIGECINMDSLSFGVLAEDALFDSRGHDFFWFRSIDRHQHARQNERQFGRVVTRQRAKWLAMV